jgi:putative phosphoesterase
MAQRIGVISDTHGLLRESAAERLSGCDLIIHAGDIGSRSVLMELEEIAEVVAVRGNVDRGTWASELKDIAHVDVEGTRICVVHDLGRLSDAPRSRTGVVIYGHSHKPEIRWTQGVLYLNPGSAGPRRFGLPISMALLHVDATGSRPELVELSA